MQNSVENYCPYCGQVKSKGNFYIGIGVQNNGRTPICKDCCKIKLDKYSAILNEESGFWVLMAEIGVPFIRDIWKDCNTIINSNQKKGKTNTDLIGYYIQKIKNTEIVYQGFWDSDTDLKDLITNNNSSINKEKNFLKDKELMEAKWGKLSDSDEAYVFLEDVFNRYTENLYNMDANLENRYKDLCIAEYMKRKAQESGDIQEISKAQENIAKLLKLLKLDDFSQETDDRDRFIDRLIWKIEETEPAEDEDLEKYRDIAGYENIFNSWMRSMRNILANTREYPDIPKEEM